MSTSLPPFLCERLAYAPQATLVRTRGRGTNLLDAAEKGLLGDVRHFLRLDPTAVRSSYLSGRRKGQLDGVSFRATRCLGVILVDLALVV